MASSRHRASTAHRAGRDAGLWLGRLRLAHLGWLAGGMDYTAVGQAVSRFGRRLQPDATLRRKLRQMEARMSKAEM